MAYNHRKLLGELDTLIAGRPRIRLSDAARTLGVNHRTIENVMRSARHTSFREYRRKELLLMARAMLNKPGLSVKEVGIRLGYSSAASFSRFVQQSTGKSPSQLRKED
jgi:AraC family transcriptional regulator, transcriptional activator of pobA